MTRQVLNFLYHSYHLRQKKKKTFSLLFEACPNTLCEVAEYFSDNTDIYCQIKSYGHGLDTQTLFQTQNAYSLGCMSYSKNKQIYQRGGERR